MIPTFSILGFVFLRANLVPSSSFSSFSYGHRKSSSLFLHNFSICNLNFKYDIRGRNAWAQQLLSCHFKRKCVHILHDWFAMTKTMKEPKIKQKTSLKKLNRYIYSRCIEMHVYNYTCRHEKHVFIQCQRSSCCINEISYFRVSFYDF